MPKGDRETGVVMSKGEIAVNNNRIIHEYGIGPEIVLRGYIPKTVTPFLREMVLRRDGFKCMECGADGIKDLSLRFDIHHIISPQNGGVNHIDNLIALCKECHIKRHK